MKEPLFKFVAGVCLLLMGVSKLATADGAEISQPKLIPANNQVKPYHGNRHFVQIISSINATKAEGMKNTLKLLGFPAFIHVSKSKPKLHYQVTIGPFISKQLAQRAKHNIIQLYPQYPFLNEAILKISL